MTTQPIKKNEIAHCSTVDGAECVTLSEVRKEINIPNDTFYMESKK